MQPFGHANIFNICPRKKKMLAKFHEKSLIFMIFGNKICTWDAVNIFEFSNFYEFEKNCLFLKMLFQEYNVVFGRPNLESICLKWIQDYYAKWIFDMLWCWVSLCVQNGELNLLKDFEKCNDIQVAQILNFKKFNYQNCRKL